MEPIAVSILYYLCVTLFCELSRRIIVDLIGPRDDKIRTILLEFLGTLQVCTCVYENHLVTRNYGLKVRLSFSIIRSTYLINDQLTYLMPGLKSYLPIYIPTYALDNLFTNSVWSTLVLYIPTYLAYYLITLSLNTAYLPNT